MKISLTKKEGISKKQKIIYTVIFLICIISILVAFYVQFFTQVDLGVIVGIRTKSEFGKKSYEEIELLKAEFDNIFTNSFTQNDEQNKDIIHTSYEKKESKENSYDIDVKIPQINIDSKIIEDYNKEIENIFKKKAEDVLASENKSIIYTVEYTANITDNILSLIIRSNLKEGTNAQRVIIQTYNYDLKENKEITFEEVMKKELINKQYVQDQIDETIKTEQEKVQTLKDLGYNIYSRDLKNDMYKIENVKEFYLKENILYIIYAYGNDSYTSEIDLIVI